jgi:hypothetical protein
MRNDIVSGAFSGVSHRGIIDVMAIDITHIQLTDAERRMLAEAAERTGKPWGEVLNEALRQYVGSAAPSRPNGNGHESLFDRMTRHGLLGCLEGGPADLSTHPAHMEGFGDSDQ